MLTDKEKEGCRELLNKLSVAELLSLADTVTKKQINVSGKTEAVRAILTYTNSPLELLQRQKMKRDVLFKYLHEWGVVVSVSAEKKKLILEILKLWNSQFVDLRDLDVDIPDDNPSTPPRPPTVANNQTNITVNVAIINQTALQVPVINPALQNPALQGASAKPETDPSLQALGEKFATWFYQMLNTFNPTTPESPGDFGPQHFWDDAKLKVTAATPAPTEEEFHGPQLVAERLVSYTKEEQLLFNPNVGKEGVFVKSSHHGLVMIMRKEEKGKKKRYGRRNLKIDDNEGKVNGSEETVEHPNIKRYMTPLPLTKF